MTDQNKAIAFVVDTLRARIMTSEDSTGAKLNTIGDTDIRRCAKEIVDAIGVEQSAIVVDRVNSACHDQRVMLTGVAAVIGYCGEYDGLARAVRASVERAAADGEAKGNRTSGDPYWKTLAHEWEEKARSALALVAEAAKKRKKK